MHVFPVLVYQDRESAYRTEVPDLRACQAVAPNLSAALEQTREAIYVQLESMLIEGRLPPKPSDLMAVHESKERARAVALTAIEIDMSRMSTAVERVNITLPKWLISRIDTKETNRSRFLAESAIEMLQNQSEDDETGAGNNGPLSAHPIPKIRREGTGRSLPLSSRFGWLDALPDAVVKALREKMYRREIPKDSFLFRSGQWDGTLFYIISGAVHLKSVSINGRDSLLTVHRAGSCIGVTTSICPLEHIYDAVAVSQLVVGCLPQRVFQELRLNHAEIDRAIAEWSAHRIWELMKIIRGDSVFDLPGRLAARIDYLLEPDDRAHESSSNNQLNISQEGLAASVGVSRQAVGKVLREWKAAGIVDYGYGYVEVLDRKAFNLIFQN